MFLRLVLRYDVNLRLHYVVHSLEVFPFYLLFIIQGNGKNYHFFRLLLIIYIYDIENPIFSIFQTKEGEPYLYAQQLWVKIYLFF